MKIEGTKTERVVVNVDAKDFFYKIFNKMQQKIIKEAKVDHKDYDGGITIRAGRFIGVVDSYGRGRDMEHDIRMLTPEEKVKVNSMLEFQRMFDEIDWSKV